MTGAVAAACVVESDEVEGADVLKTGVVEVIRAPVFGTTTEQAEADSASWF